MATATEAASECPFAVGRDAHDDRDRVRNESKSAAIAAQRLKIEAGAEIVRAFQPAREILLSKALLQGGAGAASFDMSDPDKTPVFYLDGDPHRQKRGALARFFTPKVITTRYHGIIERETERLLGQLQRDGRASLDVISFELTVAVAANIVGLTNSDLPKMAKRLATIMSAAWFHQLDLFGRLAAGLRKGLATAGLYLRDIVPAIRARRERPQDDILSLLLEKKASRKTILIECMTYAAAGMVTTREFIVMVAWHLFERPELRQDFLDGDEDRQFAILLEILRLEPIAALLHRRTDPERSGTDPVMYALDVRAIQADEAVVGPCPHALDPDRAQRAKVNGAFLSFGAGTHHCPGQHVALHEARMFLDALLRVPGIRLERAPDVGWSSMLMSYELRGAVVTCDRAAGVTPGSRSVRSKRAVPMAAALLLVAGLGGWASLSQGGAEVGTSSQTNAAVELEQTYRYAGGEAGRTAVENAIDVAIADMNGLIRGVARRRLLEANAIIGELGFSLGGDPLRASNVDGRIIESPASGAAVDWVDQFGDTVKVSQRWSGDELVQRIFNDDGSRTNVYRFAEDGQSMTMSVTIEASRLPEAIRYRLDYRKKGP
jgi:cytochrome P450